MRLFQVIFILFIGFVLSHCQSFATITSGQYELHECVKNNDIRCADKSLKRSFVSVNGRFGRQTPLEIAIERNYTEMVIFLLNAGADPNIKTNSEASLFHIAAVNGNIEVLKALIEKNVDTYEKLTSGVNALDMCIGVQIANYTDKRAIAGKEKILDFSLVGETTEREVIERYFKTMEFLVNRDLKLSKETKDLIQAVNSSLNDTNPYKDEVIVISEYLKSKELL